MRNNTNPEDFYFVQGIRSIGFHCSLKDSKFVDIIREKMESLRKGRSKVIEEGHTLILGWTDKTILLIQDPAAQHCTPLILK